MKKTALITFLTLSLEVLAAECIVKETSKTGKVLVLPQYEASVNYFFDKTSSEAFATVSWYLNTEDTRACFNQTQSKYMGREVVIPRSRASHLSVRVKGGTKETSISMFEQANGHYFGDSEKISVDFKAKKDIEQALSHGGGLVEIFGDLSFTMTTQTKKVLDNISCVKDSEDIGVLVLLRRMKEIQGEIANLRTRGKIDMEEVMSEFLGTCVTFNNVDANSFEEFDRQQQVSSSLKKAKFQIVGSVPVTVSEPIQAVSSQKIQLLDI